MSPYLQLTYRQCPGSLADLNVKLNRISPTDFSRLKIVVATWQKVSNLSEVEKMMLLSCSVDDGAVKDLAT